MKSHLITITLAFIAGTAVAFVATNIILPAIENFNIKTIDIDSAATLANPNSEIFNYRAINPTVEVYVGDGTVIPEAPEIPETPAPEAPEIPETPEPEIPNPEPEAPEENQNGATN